MAKKWSEEFEQHDYDFNALEQEMDVPVEDKVIPHMQKESIKEKPTYLRLPPMEKEEFLKVTQQLKEDGAKYNPYIKKWYVPPEVDKSKFQEYIPQKNDSSVQENVRERQIVKLTGLPVSDEMQDVLNTLERGEYVEIDRIKNTEEMRTAYSHINYATPTILLDGRRAEQANFARMLLDKGSATLDKNGKTNYDGIVDRKSHLDIVIGLPASGKSSAIVDTISNEFHSRVIDNDEVKKMIPEFNNGWGANTVHEESKKIETYAYNMALTRGDNIVLPKVGSDADKLLQHYIMPAINAGYVVNLHYVELDREKALGRMINRFITDGRFIDPQLIDKYCNRLDGNKIDKCYEYLKNSDYISGYSKWNNDVEYGKKPILAEYHNLETNYIASATQKKEEQKNGRENGNWERNRGSVDLRDNRESGGSNGQSGRSNAEREVGYSQYDTGGVDGESGQILSTVGTEQEKNNIARAINRTQKFQANRPLVENIYSLNKLTGKTHSVEDLAKAYKSGSYQDNPDADKLIKDIGKEFIRQEQVRAIAP